MSLRVLAVSAPEHYGGRLGSRVLGSADPASLFNACRHAAATAQRPGNVWADSNWAEKRRRREAFLLLHNLERDIDLLDRTLLQVQPHLLLIGAMTVCLPGAVAVAQRARDLLGEDVCVVLGGWQEGQPFLRR